MSSFTHNTTYQENRSEAIVPSVIRGLPAPTENWDNDNCGTYDPMEHIEKKIVLRCLIGASKAKKKQFKKSERLRILKLLEGKVPLINNFKQLTLNDDSTWEQISHLCQLTIHDRQSLDETIQHEFKNMKISS